MATNNPGRKKRKVLQRTKKNYQKNRESLQLAGVIPTMPEGAIERETVDPSSQDSQRFPGLDRLAIREDGKGGWSVPEAIKRKVIEVNAEVLYERRTYFDKETGLEIEIPPNRFLQNQASKVLLAADDKQYERDEPERAGKARGSNHQVNVNNQTNVAVDLKELFARVDEQRQADLLRRTLGHVDEEQQQPNGNPMGEEASRDS